MILTKDIDFILLENYLKQLLTVFDLTAIFIEEYEMFACKREIGFDLPRQVFVKIPSSRVSIISKNFVRCEIFECNLEINLTRL